MDDKLQKYRNDIIQCLIRYGGLSEEEACQRLDESKLLKFEDEDEQELFYHEVPYYWAIGLLHGRNNPKWRLDPALWPPPKA